MRLQAARSAGFLVTLLLCLDAHPAYAAGDSARTWFSFLILATLALSLLALVLLSSLFPKKMALVVSGTYCLSFLAVWQLGLFYNASVPFAEAFILLFILPEIFLQAIMDMFSSPTSAPSILGEDNGITRIFLYTALNAGLLFLITYLVTKKR